MHATPPVDVSGTVRSSSEVCESIEPSGVFSPEEDHMLRPDEEF